MSTTEKIKYLFTVNWIAHALIINWMEHGVKRKTHSHSESIYVCGLQTPRLIFIA
jgi:hypothetical protein